MPIGATLQLGNHLIAALSPVQPRIALSSREAELYAGMRGISETLGFVDFCGSKKLYGSIQVKLRQFPEM